MGFFNFFSKEKKETLDKGLSKTKESVFSKIAVPYLCTHKRGAQHMRGALRHIT